MQCNLVLIMKMQVTHDAKSNTYRAMLGKRTNTSEMYAQARTHVHCMCVCVCDYEHTHMYTYVYA